MEFNGLLVAVALTGSRLRFSLRNSEAKKSQTERKQEGDLVAIKIN